MEAPPPGYDASSPVGTTKVFEFDEELGPLVPSECTICLGGYEGGERISKLRCGHTYHAICVEGWLVSHRTCPVCRATVVRPWERAPEPARAPEDELFDQVIMPTFTIVKVTQ